MPSFSQHNLRLVVSRHCLHISVTKFQDKFASLQQVNSPNSWNKFQICCTDIYLIRFLPNLAGFRRFTWISRLHDCSKYQKPWLYSLHVHVYLSYKCTSLAFIGQVGNRAKKELHSGFSVEAGNRRIPPPVKTKVAACSGYEICLSVPFFFKIKYEWAFKKYSRIFRLFGGPH